MSLANRLKERREQLGKTQSEIASALGITPGAVGNYENGVSTPKADILFKVFDALQCDANYLFQDEMKNLKEEDTATPLEMEHLVKRYRELDTHGKEMVDFTLGKEYERAMKEKENTDEDKIIPFPQYPTVTLRDVRTFKARNRKTNLTEEQIAARLFTIWGDD